MGLQGGGVAVRSGAPGDSPVLAVGSTGASLWGQFLALAALAEAPCRVSNEDFKELHQAWVLVELFLQGQVLERGQLPVAEIRQRNKR